MKKNILLLILIFSVSLIAAENNIETILDGIVLAGHETTVLVLGNHKTKYGEYLKNKYKSFNMQLQKASRKKASIKMSFHDSSGFGKTYSSYLKNNRLRYFSTLFGLFWVTSWLFHHPPSTSCTHRHCAGSTCPGHWNPQCDTVQLELVQSQHVGWH